MHIDIHEEVRAALAHKRAVVALESTFIAHGLPYPQNQEIANELEATVRRHGAVPATIAVFDGRFTVGLDREKLTRLAHDSNAFKKANAMDLAVCAAQQKSAATTVSATAVIAARVGIRVFATGGIGGVHRGDSGDVSHDLYALAQTPIAVVSAGAKAILDLPRTVELLETLGVLVLGFGTTDFPAFYTRQSGQKIENRVDSAAECARVLAQHWTLFPERGVVVANPIPVAAALDATLINDAIERALQAARDENVTGKPLTPYLLGKLNEVTGGQSVIANRALALNNAQVAAQIAVAVAGNSESR